MIRLGIALAASLAISTLAAAEARAQAPPECGKKLDGAGRALVFKPPLSEDDRTALAAGIYLAMRDESDRGTWPVSEIDIALPCPLAQFEADGATWTIHGGEGLAPPRWIQAGDRKEVLFLAAGPGLAAARAWNIARDTAPKADDPKAYYLAVAARGEIYVFRVYDDAPSPKQLADDAFEALTGKLPPLAVLDSQAHVVSLYLPTASRRTSMLFKPELLDGGRDATLYGPDGRYFAPIAGEAVLLRGSDLACEHQYGDFALALLGVTDARDESLDLACGYQYGDSELTLFATRRPDLNGDRRAFDAYVREEQQISGVSARRPGLRTGPKEAIAAGKAWIDKAGGGQGLWLTRRGDYVIEIRAAFLPEDEARLIQAVEAVAAALGASSGR